MSRCLVDKVLFTVDRAPELVERAYEEPLAYQKWHGAQLAHMSLPYPDITT